MLSLKTQIEMRWCEIINQTDSVFAVTSQELADIKNLQSTYYKTILDIISRVNVAGKSTDLQYWNRVSTKLNALFEKAKINSFKKNGVDGYTLSSVVPVITPDTFRVFSVYLKESLSKLGSLEEHISVSNFILVSLLSVLKQRSREALDAFMDDFVKSNPVELARYLAMTTYNDLIDNESINEDLENAKSSYVRIFSETKLELESTVTDAKGRLDAIKEEVERLQGIAAGTETRILNAIKEHDEATKRNKAELEGIATSTVARANLAALGELWDGLAARSKNSMWIFGGITIVMLIVGIVLLILGKNYIMDYITEVTKADDGTTTTTEPAFLSIQISRIVVMTIPLLLYVWGLKIAVRMFIRSMALYDDATQRRTILDSYFFLTEKGVVDKDAQPIVIGAVCRPVPGHGTDGFELPDLAQLLQAGQNYFKKP